MPEFVDCGTLWRYVRHARPAHRYSEWHITARNVRWALEEGKKAEYRKLPIAELREADSLYMTHGGWSIPISAIDGRALAVDAAEIQAINDAIHSGRTHEDALKIGPTGDYE